MIFRVGLLLFCLLAASVPLAAQAVVDIRGVVSDSATGEKLPFANVVLIGQNRGAASNIQGFYLIPNVKPGTYQVQASSIGYGRRVQTVTVFPGDPVTINFKLASEAIEFSEVVVTERAKRELLEINTSIHVMEQRDIKVVPVTVQEDIFRAIQILPGIVSTSDVNSHFYVRGGSGDQNLILLDGMKIYNPFHAFGIFSIFDSDLIKTTEVYTGAFPPGFGGRLSSVVNMTTRDGNVTSFSGKANINFISSKLQLEGPVFKNTRWLVSGRKSLFSGTFDRFLKKNVPLSFYDALVKVSREGENNASYGFQGFFSGDELRSADPREADYRWRNHAVGFTASGLLQDRLYINAVGFENSFYAERDPKQSEAITPASTRITEVGVKANATLYTDSHDLFFFGFEFSFPQLEYNLINNFGIARSLKSSFVESWSWIRYQAKFEGFQIDGGIHVDVGSLFQRTSSFELLQPRVNMSVVLWPEWKGKASYGRFNQNLITVNNEDDVISIFDAWIEVPRTLRSEQADHYVLGLEGNIFRELSTSVQTYYKKYGSLITYNRDKIDALDPDYVNGTGKAYGVESLIRYGIPFLDFFASYTIGWTEITTNNFTYSPRYDRRHTLNLLTVFHLADSWDLSFRWELGSGFPFTQTIGYYDRLPLDDIFDGDFVGETGKPYSILGPKNSARLPTYHRLDGSVTYRFTVGPIKGSAGIHVINVYDYKNIFYFDRKTGQQVNMLPFFPSATLNVEY
ncbi:MAG: TonB-dependent receptor [Ignavibacteriae bacterium]|nr:TonB-dependent receptor [Ignavibacteriota bacterium]